MADREKTIMLLPTISEARILREALGEWIGVHTGATPENIDKAYAYLAKLSDEIRKAGTT